MTIFVLFHDSLRVIYFSRDADILFDWITIISLVFFTFEIVATAMVKKDYQYSFFFWLDIISTVTLTLDIQFIFADLFGSDSGGESGEIAVRG